jgi:hypothetical protein
VHEALRTGDFSPMAFSRSALHFLNGPVLRAMELAELARRAARHLRHLR